VSGRPVGTVALITTSAVVCVAIAAAAWLQVAGKLDVAAVAMLTTLVTTVVNLVRIEKVGQAVEHTADRVQVVERQTNGQNSRLQTAALTALAALPPERAREVLDRLPDPPGETSKTD
jgi:hypothetical protein